MNLKENINRIHYLFTETFQEVSLQESSDKKTGKYFTIDALYEGKKIKMKINFSDLEFANFKWQYLENPLNESSSFIERQSSVDSILEDVLDIFNKNRFSEDYLLAIKK